MLSKVLDIKDKVERLKADSEALLDSLKIKSSKVIIEKIEDVETERKALLKDLEHYKHEMDTIVIDRHDINTVNQFLKNEVNNLPDLPFKQKFDFIDIYIDKITISPEERGCIVNLAIDCDRILFNLGVRVHARADTGVAPVCAGDTVLSQAYPSSISIDIFFKIPA